MYAPWPEEINRQITTRLSSFHFAPTDNSKQNLLREGISDKKIFVTGNTVIDALKYTIDLIDENPPQIPGLPELDIKTNKNSRIVLITGHRRENIGEGFESICKAIVRLAETFPEVQFVYPVHLNPAIQGTVLRLIKSANMNNIHLIKHLGYLPFIALMKRAYILLTDSGGIQEEAPSLGKPVLVMRKITERPEGLESGVVKMVGTDEDLIVDEVSHLLNDEKYYHEHTREIFPYGDGKACKRIHQYIKDFFYNN
jgi:UDP-N-acetylglucosamine 2-epimerase (non-hydrolysing)